MGTNAFIWVALAVYQGQQETYRQVVRSRTRALVVLVPAVLCCWLASQGHMPLR